MFQYRNEIPKRITRRTDTGTAKYTDSNNPRQTRLKEESMRVKFILIIFVLVLSGISACQQNADSAAEKKAIKEVIEKGLNAAKTFDYEGMAAVWAHEPYVVLIRAGEDRVVGWDSLSDWYKIIFEKYKGERGGFEIKELTATEYDIDIHGNIAYVIYDEYIEVMLGGNGYLARYDVIKYLELKNGKWKLLVSGKRGEPQQRYLKTKR
jgi:hypothetical protein